MKRERERKKEKRAKALIKQHTLVAKLSHPTCPAHLAVSSSFWLCLLSWSHHFVVVAILSITLIQINIHLLFFVPETASVVTLSPGSSCQANFRVIYTSGHSPACLISLSPPLRVTLHHGRRWCWQRHQVCHVRCQRNYIRECSNIASCHYNYHPLCLEIIRLVAWWSFPSESGRLSIDPLWNVCWEAIFTLPRPRCWSQLVWL